jgi:ABC-2 type transport system ATP-binding protein
LSERIWQQNGYLDVNGTGSRNEYLIEAKDLTKVYSGN